MAIADTPPQPDARRQQLKSDFIARRGYWTPWLDGTLRFGLDFFDAFLAFTGTPWATGPLPPKVKEFVYIAIDGAITHLIPKSSNAQGACSREDPQPKFS